MNDLLYVDVLQETSLSSADGVSRYSQPHSAEFATPKARLFHSLKYGSASASSLLPASSLSRTSESLEHNESQSVLTGAAETCMSPRFMPLSPQPRAAASSLLNVHRSTLHADFTNKLPETTFAACSENSFASRGDEDCAEKDDCFRKPSTSQRC